MNKNIKYLPIRIEHQDRISHLEQYIESEQEINTILKYIDTEGYKILNLGDVKFQLLQKEGMTFEELGNILRQHKSKP